MLPGKEWEARSHEKEQHVDWIKGLNCDRRMCFDSAKNTNKHNVEKKKEKKNEMNWAKPKMYLFLGIRHTLNRSRGKLVSEFIMHILRDKRLFVFNLITFSNIRKAIHIERKGLTNTTNHTLIIFASPMLDCIKLK